MSGPERAFNSLTEPKAKLVKLIGGQTLVPWVAHPQYPADRTQAEVGLQQSAPFLPNSG